jgi:uncharacterized protein (DUF58 family)
VSAAASQQAIPNVRVDLRELLALRGPAAQLAQVAVSRTREDMGGAHASPFRGRGMEYAESRPYAAGDDVRHIDWRVTARTGKTHTKLFQPERDRSTGIVYDASPSMAFGTRGCFKSVQAARLAALMVWHALREGDRLAAAVCGTTNETLPPMGGRRGALRLLDAIERWQPVGRADTTREPATLARALDHMNRLLRPGSRVLLLLDPRSLDAAAGSALTRLHAHHDIAALLIADALELAAPPRGDYRVGDGQNIAHAHLETDLARARWNRHFIEQQEAAAAILKRNAVRHRIVSTRDDPVAALRALLGKPAREAVA